MINPNREPAFIYTYAASEEEVDLCRLEQRMLFDFAGEAGAIKSERQLDLGRSPFIKERIEIYYKGKTVDAIVEQIQALDLKGETFKVKVLKQSGLPREHQIDFQTRRNIEKEIGQSINGVADLKNPRLIFGVIHLDGYWYIGLYEKSEPMWLRHVKKPHEYSTALNTRMARAVVNIAVPNPVGIRAIDPCCGIGTVLVEALSMGVEIVGRDINPLVCVGTRENIAHFGYTCQVTKGPIEEVMEHYDVAIVDLPYNLCTTASPEEQLSILRSAKRIADKVVVVSSEKIDDMLTEAGLMITDRAEARKSTFIREILVCK